MRLLLPSLLFISPAFGQADPGTQSAQGQLDLTIYADLALIEDVREVDLPKATVRHEFADVSAAILPETVSLTGAAIEIVEQNFDFDLLSPAKLMQKAEGREITLIRKDPLTDKPIEERAKVLAVNGGVVMQVGSKIEILRDDDSPTRVIFDEIPSNLRARPTLSVTMDSKQNGTRPLTLSYLSKGLGWKADYVGLFDEQKGSLDLQGWVTLTNNSGTTFRDARLTLVAGEVLHMQKDNRDGQFKIAGSNTASTRSDDYDDEDDKAKKLGGDLLLYPLEGRTTVATNQKKQIGFLDISAVQAERVYEFYCRWGCETAEPVSAISVLKFNTGKDGGLGAALPAGIARIYMRDSTGKARFVGESKIDHVAKGQDVRLATSVAFDVKVRPTIEKRERISSDEWIGSTRYRIFGADKDATAATTIAEKNKEYWRTQMRFTVTNARSQPVSVDLRQFGLRGWNEQTRILSETVEGRQNGSDERTWLVKVPANGRTDLVVTYLSAF
ncbi:MAG: DUF4139 domain-containing protein [Sphingorhabdus sp.]